MSGLCVVERSRQEGQFESVIVFLLVYGPDMSANVRTVSVCVFILKRKHLI